MALHVPKAQGFSQMLKDGARHFAGLEEAIYRNIKACKEFSSTLKTAYGPQGRNKMVINHLEKLYVTNDAATIIRELEIEHPAAKLIVLASQMQEQEAGDGTNWVVIFAGALLEAAEEIIRMGVTPRDVAQGYQMALEKALEELPKLTCWEIKDIQDVNQVTNALKTCIMSKQYGNEDFLASLVAKACICIASPKKSFNVDSIRICKILGCGIHSSEVVEGMVFQRNVEGAINRVEKAKVAVYSCPFDVITTETKGTVLINTAEELANFSRGEESKMEQDVKALADSGVTVVAAGGKVGDLALHYLNKYKIMAVRIPSKWDLRRLCKTVGATILPKFVCPSPEEIGLCDLVFVDELGNTPVIIFRQLAKEAGVATIVIRGATTNHMDDIERSIDDAVNTYKGLTRDGRFLPGAGSVEVELSGRIEKFGAQCPGLEQYAIKKFADSLNIFPKVLADNCGAPSQETLSNLISAHQSGKEYAGFDCQGEGAAILDAKESGIVDAFLTKFWAIKYATSAACQILCVDEIIMAKRAGGPKPRPMGPQDADDDE